MNLVIIILAVIFGAVADGLNEAGRKLIGHPIEGIEKVLLLLAGALSGTWIVIISYIGIRIALFDLVKNIAKGDPVFYLGDSCWWDRFLSRFPVHGVTFARVVVLVVSVSVAIKYI